MMEAIHEALAKREEQAKRALRNLCFMDRFRFAYTILSFCDIDRVDEMLKFHEESPPSDRLHFQTAAGMLVTAGYSIDNRYVASTKGGCLFVQRGKGAKYPLDISFDTINIAKVEYLVNLRVVE